MFRRSGILSNVVLHAQARGRGVMDSTASRMATPIGQGHGVYPRIGAGITGHRGYPQSSSGLGQSNNKIAHLLMAVALDAGNGFGYGYFK